MNPNAEAFKPRLIRPEPGMGDISLRVRSSQQVPKIVATYTKKSSNPDYQDTLDPKNYDSMFPSLETSAKKPGPSKVRTSSRNKKGKAPVKHVAREAQDSRTLDPSVLAVEPASSALSFDLQVCNKSVNSGKPRCSTPIREPPKTKLHMVKPVTPLKPALVENKQRVVTSAPLPAPAGKIKSQVGGLSQVVPNMPPTPKPDIELPMLPMANEAAASNKSNPSSTFMQSHASPIPVPPFPDPFNYLGAGLQPPLMPPNGGLFYYPTTYSPSFMPVPQMPMPQMPMPQMPIPQMLIPMPIPLQNVHMPQHQSYEGQVA
ncbi:hypothetical protein BGZ63DRAFT_423475 [Mariannaea sp. PMI_226]|nr:hypothetical protein BGZ63DRAFT_423475 [Mariannaea sp. PMI_226]